MQNHSLPFIVRSPNAVTFLYTKKNLTFFQHKSRKKAIHFYLSQILNLCEQALLYKDSKDKSQQQHSLSSLSHTFPLLVVQHWHDKCWSPGVSAEPGWAVLSSIPSSTAPPALASCSPGRERDANLASSLCQGVNMRKEGQNL